VNDKTYQEIQDSVNVLWGGISENRKYKVRGVKTNKNLGKLYNRDYEKKQVSLNHTYLLFGGFPSCGYCFNCNIHIGKLIKLEGCTNKRKREYLDLVLVFEFFKPINGKKIHKFYRTDPLGGRGCLFQYLICELEPKEIVNKKLLEWVEG